MIPTWLVVLLVGGILITVVAVTCSRALRVLARLEVAATEAKASAGALWSLMERVGIIVEAGAATGLRAEAGAKIVAGHLVIAQQAVDDLAEDVADRTRRADEAEGLPGEAGDAFGQSAKP